MTSQNSEYAQTTNSSEFMLPVMWRCVAGLVVPDVSKERSVFFKSERVHKELFLGP